MTIVGCAHVRERKEVEVWLIDHKDLLLFRVIKGGKEQVIPIKDNPDMNRFIVIDKQEYLEFVLDEIERE